MRLPFKFLIFFENFLLKTPKSPPSIFGNFATEWMLKNLKGSLLSQFPALWHFSKGITFVLKLGFLRSGTLYPIFVVLKDRCFFYATFFKNCYTEAPPQFLPETKRFARVKDSSRFSALCYSPETIKNIFEKFRNFFLNFLFFKGFSLRKMRFCCFQLGKNGFRDLCVSFRVFFGAVYCKIDEVLMSFYPWFSLWYCLFGFLQKFAGVCEARLRLCVFYGLQ